MLDPIPLKILKEVLPEVIDPLLPIINLSLSLGYVSTTFKLAVIKPLLLNYYLGLCIINQSQKNILSLFSFRIVKDSQTVNFCFWPT